MGNVYVLIATAKPQYLLVFASVSESMSRYDFGVVLLCSVVFLKALYKRNAGL